MSAEASSRSIHEIRDFTLARLQELLDVSRHEVDRRAPLHRYGLDSAKAVRLVAALSEYLGRPIPFTLVWDHPTVEGLSVALARGTGGGPTAPRSLPGRSRTTRGAPEPVALVGIGCRLPGAPDPASFWRLLTEGREAVGPTPPSRRDLAGDGGAPRWGGHLDDIDLFDPLFFGISPREATAMDPQQRLILELAWEALEDAGVPPRGLVGSDTGVFMGASWSDYMGLAHRAGTRGPIGPHTATGTHDSVIANRVSYVLGLQGPSMALDTACSSSLVAVHLACQSIRSGESDLALAGGVNLAFLGDHFAAMDQLGALSPDGRCKTFDARADGYVRGEGAAVVVLAPLRTALERGLPVYCVIRGGAVNNDGHSNGLTAPNPLAQEALLRTAYDRAGVSPSRVDYVECHGTGTPLGDPIEAKALAAVLGPDRDPGDPLRIGSVKTNIGHLEPAAGIAGLVKVALSLRNGVLPASLHYDIPNPRIPFESAGLRVQDRTTPWPRRPEGRSAGVSAFGFGGTSCHVVAEELPHPEHALLLLAEDSREALDRRVSELRTLLVEDPGAALPALCSQALRALGNGPHRLAAVARDRAELLSELTAFEEGRPHDGLTVGESGRRRPRVAFLCSGTGSQWLGMGRRLAVGSPAFRRSLTRVDERVRELSGLSVADLLFAAEEDARLDDMEAAQPLLFAVQVALADTWRSLGVEPDVVLGQSVGEFTAAYLSGALGFDDATLLATHHARLVQQLAVGGGDSVVAACAAERVLPLIAAEGDRVTLSGRLGPESTLLSGATDDLDALTGRLAAEGVAVHRVRMGYAAHSPQVEPVLAPLTTALRPIAPTASRIPMISTVTGAEIAGEELGPAYWADNVRRESRLTDAVATLGERGVDAVIELSPHPVLLRPVAETLAGRGVTCLPSLRRGVDDDRSLLAALGALHVAGHPVAADALVTGARGRHAPPGPRGATGPAVTDPVEGDDTCRPRPWPTLVPVTAHSPEALRDTCRELAGHVERDPDLRTSDLGHTLATRRTPLAHRAVLLASDRREVLRCLARAGAEEPHPDVVRGRDTGGGDRRVAFVFSGSGAHWVGMGRELLRWHEGFREWMAECDRAVAEVAGWSVLDALAAPLESSRLDEMDIQQPVLFALQVCLARLWRSLGVEPSAVVGHSIGEVAAAVAGGALSLADGARVTVVRSHLMQHKAVEGAMIAVEASEEELAPHLAGHEARLGVAALNSPTSTVVSGAPDAVRVLTADLERAGVPVRTVRVERPAHSVLMDPVLPPLREELRDVEPRPFAIPFHSTAVPDAVSPRVDADYWVSNFRRAVRLAPAISALVADGIDTFVEIGPHGVLRGAVEETALAHGVQARVVESLRRGESDTRSLLGSVAILYADGVPMDLESLFPRDARVVETPLVRWQKDRYWLDAPPPAPDSRDAGAETASRRSAEPVRDTPEAGAPVPDAADESTPTREALLGEIAETLGLAPAVLSAGSRLVDFGLDSMLAIRLSNRMQTLVGHRMSPVEFVGERTVGELLDHLLGLVVGPRPTAVAAPPARAGTDRRTPFVETLTEPDAEELLDELVARGLLPAPDDTTPALDALRAAGEDDDAAFRVAPAGHGQSALWFMQQLSPDGVAYNLMFGARVTTPLDPRVLERAVRALVERHPALRTVFVEAGGRPYQLVLKEPVHEFLAVDASGLDDDEVRRALIEHGHRPLDLDEGPILRAVLMSRGPRDHHLLLVVHHVASDAETIDIVVRDLQELYGLMAGGASTLLGPAPAYTDFVEWERDWLEGPEAKAALDWWAGRLENPPPHLDLPRADGSTRAGPRAGGVGYTGEDLTFRWDAEAGRALKDFAVREGVSMSTLLLAGFFAALNRLAGVEDAVVATAVAQRGAAGRESAVGYYLNTVPVRARPSADRDFRELLAEVHAYALGLLEHMDYPFDLLVSELNPPRPEGRPPWFDFAVNWLSGDAFTSVNTLFHGIGDPVGPTGALPLVPLPLERHFAKFDLEITMTDVAGEVIGQVQYKPDFLERETVTTLLEHFRSVLLEAIDSPDGPLARPAAAPPKEENR
ncbi:acyltransferase domain-containing protein [Streptomyces sp. WMMC905]|uniref:acyltransferase domain-containing protein n=1 Tax=Streptomyces sp. WMMC905 TaxID=3404123 RepID=UPI003B9238EC